MLCQRLIALAAVAVWVSSQAPSLSAKNPVQNPKNTVTLQQTEAIEPVSFSPILKFHIEDVVDRTGNSPPNLLYERDDGIFLNEEPKVIVRQRVEDTLMRGYAHAADANSADYLLTIYIVHFGYARGIGKQIFVKVELNVDVRNSSTGETEQVSSFGTSLTGKKKFFPIVMEYALTKAVRGVMRGTRFNEAVRKLEASAQARAAALAAERAEAEARAREAAAARQRETEAEAPPEQPGTVLVSSTLPGAEVYVDNGFVGNTPAKIRLNPGKYTVRVVMAGQEDWTRQLSVLPGSELKVAVAHTPKAPAPPEPSSDPKALSKSDILGLLTNFVPNPRIAALVREHGIKFTPTSADFDEIAEAGGNSNLLEALRQAAARNKL